MKTFPKIIGQAPINSMIEHLQKMLSTSNVSIIESPKGWIIETSNSFAMGKDDTLHYQGEVKGALEKFVY